MKGEITVLGDSIFVGIFEDEIRETKKAACVVEFESVEDLREFMKAFKESKESD